MASEEPARQLSTFVKDVVRLLDEVQKDQKLLPADLRGELGSLLDDARASAGELEARLSAIESGADPSARQTLKDAGLEGRSLKVKLDAVYRALDAYRAASGRTGSQPRPRGLRGIRSRLETLWERIRGGPSGVALRRLASLLRWIDVPLESIVAALGQGETLKEVKKWLEAAVMDVQENRAGSPP